MNDADSRREALKRWMASNNFNPNAIARKAGISTSAIYNFLSGSSNSLSSNVYQKLADAAGCTVDDILTGAKHVNDIRITHRVGSGGRMFSVDEDEELSIKAPPGISGNVAAALVDGDGLHPVPAGWAVVYEVEPADPHSLIGKVALVRWDGGGERPVVRTVRRGGQPGTFSLQAFSGAITEDVEILAAHKVVCFSAP